MKVVELEKRTYEEFGFHAIGGNKTGIYVKSVEQYKPAARANFQIGWKILKVNFLLVVITLFIFLLSC